MLKESMNEADHLNAFAKRISSIKRDRERKEIIYKLNEWKACNITTEKIKSGQSLVKVKNLLTQNQIREMTEIDCSELSEEVLIDLLMDYLTFIMSHLKYKKSAGRKMKGMQPANEEVEDK